MLKLDLKMCVHIYIYPGQNEALENFLNKVMAYLFDPKNKRKFVDNLTHGEREALRDLSTWNKDEKNPRVIRVQDKGSMLCGRF